LLLVIGFKGKMTVCSQKGVINHESFGVNVKGPENAKNS
jgi:hypothetical protein